MRIGSLFSGIGGLELGLEWAGVGETAWHAEVDPHASSVLARHYDVPNLGDVTAVDWAEVEPVDVLCGGFPCQDISYAGLGAGLQGERSALWWELWRAARGLRPRWLVVENVAALRNRGLDVVTHSLASIGYVGSWATLRASDVGAPHQRARVFLVAADAECGAGGEPDRRAPVGRRAGDAEQAGLGGGHPLADADGRRCQVGPELDGQPIEDATDRRPRRRHADGCGEPPADADGPARRRERPGSRSGPLQGVEVDGWPAQQPRRRGSSGGPAGAVAAPDTDGSRLGQDERHLRQGQPDVAWGVYEPAIRRWEQRLGRRAPAPVDDRGRLSPPFVEWMMGFPEGWTDELGRNAALRCLGNAVVPQVAEVVGRSLALEVAA